MNESQAGPDKPTSKTSEAAETLLRMALPQIFLRGVSGRMFGKRILIPRKLVIGRADDCDLIIDEPGVSRHHAEIERNFQKIVVRDLGSANGTRVNGEPVQEAQISVGDQVSFDQQRFLLTRPGVDEERARQSPAVPSPRSVHAPEPGTVKRLLGLAVVLVAALTGVVLWLLV